MSETQRPAGRGASRRDKRQINVLVSHEQYNAMYDTASRRGLSMSGYGFELIKQALDGQSAGLSAVSEGGEEG